MLFGGELAEKTIGIMRPADASGDRERQWAVVVTEARRAGIDLPEYDGRGGLFTTTGEYWMVAPFRPGRPEEREVARAFRTLLRSAPAGRFVGGLPLAEMLTRITLRSR